MASSLPPEAIGSDDKDHQLSATTFSPLLPAGHATVFVRDRRAALRFFVMPAKLRCDGVH
jgi:hypothetical protein